MTSNDAQATGRQHDRSARSCHWSCYGDARRPAAIDVKSTKFKPLPHALAAADLLSLQHGRFSNTVPDLRAARDETEALQSKKFEPLSLMTRQNETTSEVREIAP